MPESLVQSNGAPLIQIVHVGGNDWMTVLTVDNKPHQSLYDSLYTGANDLCSNTGNIDDKSTSIIYTFVFKMLSFKKVE